MNTELMIDAIDVEFDRICSNCGRFCDENGNCPGDACIELSKKGYKKDEDLLVMLQNGETEPALKRMDDNIRAVKRNNPELFQ